MKVTLEDALSLLGKYVEERKPVLAVFVTPSMSVARVTGTIRISVVDGVTPYLIARKEDRLKGLECNGLFNVTYRDPCNDLKLGCSIFSFAT
jgi:hypothetical protein